MDWKRKWRPKVAHYMVLWAAIVIAGYLYVLWGIYHPEDSFDDLRQLFQDPLAIKVQRSEAARNWGLFALGVIGLPLAIWRAAIASSQANEAIAQGKRVERQMSYTEKQIETTERQIQLSEENNLAVLLEKAASLLPEVTDPKTATGIGILYYIASKTAFAREATDLLSNFVSGKTLKFEEPRLLRVALGHLETIARGQAKPVLANATIEADENCIPFKWLEGITYSNCEFTKEDFTEAPRSTYDDCNFFNCVLGRQMRVSKSAEMHQCHVQALRILGGSANSVKFYDCDFSGCKLLTGRGHELDDCFYFSDNPPSPAVLKRLQGSLTVRNREEYENQLRVLDMTFDEASK